MQAPIQQGTNAEAKGTLPQDITGGSQGPTDEAAALVGRPAQLSDPSSDPNRQGEDLVDPSGLVVSSLSPSLIDLGFGQAAAKLS